MGPQIKISFADRGAELSHQELIYIHAIYSEATLKKDFIVAAKKLCISLMHYLKAAQLRDIEIHIENGFQWKL